MKKGWYIYQKILNILSLVLAVGSTLFLAIYWANIPDKIPAHYGASGEVDRYGGKGELIFIQVIIIVMYIGLTIVERSPRIWNTGVTVTPWNREVVYQEIMNLLITMKFIMMVIFIYIQGMSMFSRNLGSWFLAASLIVTFGEMAFFLGRLYIKTRKI